MSAACFHCGLAAVLTARTEGRARTAAIIETARLNEEISSVMPPQSFPPRMEPQAGNTDGARTPGQSSRTPPHASKGGTSSLSHIRTSQPIWPFSAKNMAPLTRILPTSSWTRWTTRTSSEWINMYQRLTPRLSTSLYSSSIQFLYHDRRKRSGAR